MVTETEHVDVVFPALKLCDFGDSSCILNSIGPNSVQSVLMWLLTLKGCQKLVTPVQLRLHSGFVSVELLQKY